MRIPRLFVEMPLQVGMQCHLPDETDHYVRHVLRLRVGAEVCLFNGLGGEYMGQIVEFNKKHTQAEILQFNLVEHESPLDVTLVQAISKSEHMDYTIQKAVELGVQHIVPIVSERSPPLNTNRMAKRLLHWQKVIISACEQCGRNQLPHLAPIIAIQDYLTHPLNEDIGLLLQPYAGKSLRQAVPQQPTALRVLVGAEGGLTEHEICQANRMGYESIRLGTRTLRTETAALTILSITQLLWGDLDE